MDSSRASLYFHSSDMPTTASASSATAAAASAAPTLGTASARQSLLNEPSVFDRLRDAVRRGNLDALNALLASRKEAGDKVATLVNR